MTELNAEQIAMMSEARDKLEVQAKQWAVHTMLELNKASAHIKDAATLTAEAEKVAQWMSESRLNIRIPTQDEAANWAEQKKLEAQTVGGNA